MPTRRRDWDDPWRQYPASVPLPTEEGIATSKQRGTMASTWWSKRLVALLDSYGLGSRMQRGRRYARQGQLVSFDVQPGLLVAQVQGSRRTPYVVTVTATALTEPQWGQVETAVRSRAAFAAQLLAGEVPPELEDVFASAGVPLFPSQWAHLQANCSCPDWENPCKHIAAVLYVFADRLDTDPWLLLLWRGRGRDELLGHLRSSPAAGGSEIAPWWPFVPGGPRPEPALLVSQDDLDLSGDGLDRRTDDRSRAADDDALVHPAAVLRRCEPLDVDVRGAPVVALLDPAYEAFDRST
jgi:hypothetical protein